MAIRTVSNIGGAYNLTTTWVEGLVPTTADNVVFTATSGDLTINTGALCNGIDFTNYPAGKTITFNNTLSIFGASINLGTGLYTQAGTSGIIIVGNASTTGLTSNGVIWSRTFTFAGGGTGAIYTLNDDWNFTGNLSFNNTNTLTLNGFNIYTKGLSVPSNNPSTGTTNIIFNGTGTWSATGSGAIGNNIIINTTGTLTISGFVYYQTGTITYITATNVITTGSYLFIIASATLNTGIILWDTIYTSGINVTLTLTGNLNTTNLTIFASISSFVLGGNVLSVPNNLTITGACTFNVPQNLQVTNLNLGNGTSGAVIMNGAFTISVSGNLTEHRSTFSASGTTSILLNGTGVWSNNDQVTQSFLQNNLTIDTTGTITIGTNISPNVYYRTGILTYTAGTVDTITKNSSLNIGGPTTLDTDRGATKINWNTIIINSTSTLTLLSNLNTTNLYLNGTLSFVLGGNNLLISGTLMTGYVAGTTTFNVPQNLQVTNLLLGNGFSSNQTLNGLFTISVSGNLTENHGLGAASGSTTILLNGTGTWSNSNTGSLQNNLNINTTGTITLGTSVYYQANILTYISGNVITTGSTLNIPGTCTLNTNGINWNNVTMIGGTQTLTSDLYCQNLTSGIGASNTINGLFDVNVRGNLTASGVVSGTATIVLIGTGLWTAPNGSNTFRTSVIINTNGIITLANTLDCGGNLTYIKGPVKSNNTTITFGTGTLINMHKLIFKNVILNAGITTTMNEFFNGSAGIVTNIISTSSSNNYNITFQDNFEKIAKFVNISNCTLTKPLQLLVITNSKRNLRNRGIRYINQSPNGIAKNEPSTLTQTTYGTQMLLNDPAMK